MLTNKENVFLIVLETGSCPIETPAVSGERLISGSQTALLSLQPHRAEGAKELSGVCFLRTLIPSVRAPSS